MIGDQIEPFADSALQSPLQVAEFAKNDYLFLTRSYLWQLCEQPGQFGRMALKLDQGLIIGGVTARRSRIRTKGTQVLEEA